MSGIPLVTSVPTPIQTSILSSILSSGTHRMTQPDNSQIAPEDSHENSRKLWPGSPQARFAVVGNCQVLNMSRCIQALTGDLVPPVCWATDTIIENWRTQRVDLNDFYGSHERVFMQPWVWERIRDAYPQLECRTTLFPSIGFMGLHPDLIPVLIRDQAAPLDEGPLGRGHSSIVLLAWKLGLSIDETISLFNEGTFKRLGFYAYWQDSKTALIEEGRNAGMDLLPLFPRWASRGCFMHDHVHSKLFVSEDVARALLQKLGIQMQAGDPVEYVNDELANGSAWPVYPEIASRHGFEGNYLFKRPNHGYRPYGPVRYANLRTFITECFETYDQHQGAELYSPRFELESYRELIEELEQKKKRGQSLAKEKFSPPLIQWGNFA